jgi:type I restriction enzyme S subunit
MPTYTCTKCARVFKQKSGYDDHMNKKVDCIQNTVLDAVIEKKVKQAINASQHKQEVTKETFPAFFEDLHNLLWNKAGLSPERALEHMTFFFAYRLIEQQADALSLPQECRWSYIANIKNAGELFAEIENGTAKFWENPVTQIFFKPHEIKKVDLVYDIVQEINRISLKTLQETDSLGDMFEYMLGRGMSTMSDEGQYFTNRTICKLAFKLAYDIKKNLRRTDGTLCTFADWFCGTGGFPAEFIKGVKQNLPSVDWEKEFTSIYCQDMNLSSVTSTLLNMLILTGVPFSGEKIRGSNSFSEPITTGAGAPFNGVTIDYCFMNPPYGGDKTKGKEYKFAYSKKVKGEDGSTTKKFFVNQEIQSIGIEDDDKVSAGVQLAMATLSAHGGVCSIVLPQGFFFGASKKCVELRKKIAEEYKIWYVVDIASGSFLNTGTKTSMMIFQKGVGPTEKVSFIGLDEKPLVEATLAELRAKHYSLNYKQYLPQSAVEVEGFRSMPLNDVCVFKRGTMITKANLTDGKVPVIGGGLSPMGYHNESNRPANSILISQSGENAGHISKYNIPVWASDCFSIETKSDELNNEYLYHILKSIEPSIKALKNGTAQPHVYPSSIEHLIISVPSLERQQQIVEAIDGWTNLAQQEEVALKILEKQMMFQVKEMGRGQARVKLGEVCEIESGTYITKKTATEGEFPVYGGGDVSSRISEFNRESKFVIAKDGVSETCVRYVPGKFFLNHHGWTFVCKDAVLYSYMGYWLLNNQQSLYELATGTAQKGINQVSFYGLEIPLPPLTEQQTLQSDFDEIRHKHAKIAVYKAKTQEAIQRLIPTA